MPFPRGSIKRGHNGHLGGAPEWCAGTRKIPESGLAADGPAVRADVNHDMSKTRLSKEGEPVEAPKGKELKGDLERIASQKGEGYCACPSSSVAVAQLLTGIGRVQVGRATAGHRQSPAAATRARRCGKRTFDGAGASSTPTPWSRSVAATRLVALGAGAWG